MNSRFQNSLTSDFPDVNRGIHTVEPQSAALRWPSRRWLDDVPADVVAVNAWPLWRRLMLIPDDATYVKIKAWRELARTSWMARGIASPEFPGARKSGIFAESRVHWDQLARFDNSGHATLDGMARSAERPRLASLTNPHGPLIVSAVVDSFNCDITDVDGISASKSSALHFDNLDAFGEFFRAQKDVTFDEDGLARMLKHDQVRIINEPGVDSFSVRMWDGRLFLGNAGGSHHFAAAARIAKAIGSAVSLSAKLHVHWLNVPAWEWLLARYRVTHVPSGSTYWSRADVAEIVDECYLIDLPPRFDGREFLLLPCDARGTPAVLEVLAKHGTVEITDQLQSLLRGQLEVQKLVSARWAELPGPPWSKP